MGALDPSCPHLGYFLFSLEVLNTLFFLPLFLPPPLFKLGRGERERLSLISAEEKKSVLFRLWLTQQTVFKI